MMKVQGSIIEGNGHSNTLPASDNAAWRGGGKWKAMSSLLLTTKRMKFDHKLVGEEAGGENGRRRMDDRVIEEEYAGKGDREMIDNAKRGTGEMRNTSRRRSKLTRDQD
jgi:hypothetical protein